MTLSILVLLAVLITIDASRILYLPLAKIHPSHHEFKSTPLVQEGSQSDSEEKLIRDELMPLPSMERHMYEEDENDQRELDYMTLFDREAPKSSQVQASYDQSDAASSRYSQLNENQNNDEPWVADTASSRLERLQLDEAISDSEKRQRRNDALFLLIVGTCSVVGILGLVAAAVFWYRIQKRAEATLDADYPSYGVNGPGGNAGKIASNSTISDRKLAQSAQMFHYQQQRQQMMAQEKAHLDTKPAHSDDSDDEAPGGGDYTVYECPGLAPTGEMEVRNPLFAEPEPSPSATHPATNNHYPQLSSVVPSPPPPPTQDKPSS